MGIAMKSGLLTGCLVTALSASLGAQTPQALATIAAVGQHVWLDVARQDPGILTFGGWAFECSSGTQAITELVIDGTVATNVVLFPAAREDVKLWAMTYSVCDFAHTPYYSGVNAWLSVADAHLAVGPHAAQLRIRNTAGVMTLSPPVGFDVK
jgi:hypothetical protein